LTLLYISVANVTQK